MSKHINFKKLINVSDIESKYRINKILNNYAINKELDEYSSDSAGRFR